jgi:hypothetical protein
MRRLILALSLTAVLALPFSSAAPVSAGGPQENLGCPEGTSGVYIQELQFFIREYGAPAGLARHAAAQDVNHDSIVCASGRGRRGGVTFTDNTIFYCGCAALNRDDALYES